MSNSTMSTNISSFYTLNGTTYTNSSTGFNNILLLPDLHFLKAVCCGSNDTNFLNDCNFLFSQFEDPFTKLEIAHGSKVVLMILYSVIMILSLFGNSLVFLTLIMNKYMRSTTNVFIVSLAASDLVLTLSAVPINLGEVVTTFWIFGSFACKLIPCLENFCVACSSLTLCCIAIERYYAIVYPFKLKFFQTPSRAGFLLVAVWLISGVACFPQALFYHVEEMSYQCDFKYKCVFEQFDKKELFQTWLNFVVLFMVPFLIMLITYGIIIHRLWIKHPIGASTNMADSNRLRIKKRAIKMLMTVVVLFVISWLPVTCFNIVSEKYNLIVSQKTLNWRMYLHFLALSSCCYNPIIYTFMNEKFRQNFANIIFCKKKKVYPVFVPKKNRLSLEARDPVKKEKVESLQEPSQSIATAETRV